MFNANVKQKFIEMRTRETVHPEEFYYRIFEMAGSFEKEYNRDISAFNKSQILGFYKFLNFSTAQTYRNINSILNMYTQFCFDIGLLENGQNHYSFIDTNDFNSCVNSKYLKNMLITEEDMRFFLNDLYNSRDQFLILSLFEFGTSKKYKDIVTIKISDIDEESEILHLDGRVVKVSKQWINIAHEADECLEYKLYNDSKHHEKIDLMPSEYIYKESIRARKVEDDLARTKRMAHGFLTLRDYLGMPREIKMKNIITSGKIATIRRESKVIGMDPVDYIKLHKKEIDNQFGSMTVWSHFIDAFKDYLY